MLGADNAVPVRLGPFEPAQAVLHGRQPKVAPPAVEEGEARLERGGEGAEVKLLRFLARLAHVVQEVGCVDVNVPRGAFGEQGHCLQHLDEYFCEASCELPLSVLEVLDLAVFVVLCLAFERLFEHRFYARSEFLLGEKIILLQPGVVKKLSFV